MAGSIGLARVTVSGPRRRVDVALPENVAVADLLAELLGQVGEDLADDGERHGGWVLRRVGGTPVDAAKALHQQGIRDGEVLYLTPAREEWPDLEYDDVVEAIAAGAGRTGRTWHPGATRAAAAATGAAALTTGLAAVLLASPRWTVALAVALALLLAGVTASRTYGDGIGAGLAGFALPYAAAGGALLGVDGPSRLLLAATALLLTAAVAAVGVGNATWVFIAGIATASAGLAGGLLGYRLPAHGAAAIVLAALVCGVPAVPLLAIRLGRLPIPPVPPVAAPLADDSPAGTHRPPPPAMPSRIRIWHAVRRTTELLTGMLVGLAVATVGAAVVLVTVGGPAGQLLVGVSGVVLLLRARLFVAVRQRVPVLVAGVVSLAALAVVGVGAATPDQALALVIAAVAIALLITTVGTSYARRPASPYLSRAADLVDTVLVVSVIPIACAVLNLYAQIRSLAG